MTLFSWHDGMMGFHVRQVAGGVATRAKAEALADRRGRWPECVAFAAPRSFYGRDDPMGDPIQGA